MNLLLLAAGEGTRFRPHTSILPKPALPLCGVPLLFFPYYLTKELSPAKIVINTFHLPSEIHKVGKSLGQFGTDVVFSDEEDVLMGSGGGIARAKRWLDDGRGFLVFNADEVILPKHSGVMTQFVSQAEKNRSLSTLMVMRHPEAGHKFGAVWSTAQGRVIGFGKTPPSFPETLIPYHFIGPMYFNNRIFEFTTESPSNILHDVLKNALSVGERVDVFPIECDWLETGNLEDYLVATQFLMEKMSQQNQFLKEMYSYLGGGIEWIQTSTARILKHPSATIEPSAQLNGFVVLGASSKISKHARLENVVCGDNVILAESSRYSNSLILKDLP